MNTNDLESIQKIPRDYGKMWSLWKVTNAEDTECSYLLLLPTLPYQIIDVIEDLKTNFCKAIQEY